jgi:hypothetical protein
MRSVGRLAAAWVGVLVIGAAARAGGWSLASSSDLALRPVQDETPALEPEVAPFEPEPLSGWAVAIEPMWWYPGLAGDLTISGSTSSADIEDLQIDEPDSAPMVEAMLRDGPYTARVSGFFFSQSAESEAQVGFTIGTLGVAPGDTIDASVDFDSFEATWGYLLWDNLITDDAGQTRVEMRLDGFVGLRGYDLDFSASTGGQPVSDQANWADVIVGARLEVEMTRRFSWDLAVDIGGFAWDDATSGSVNVLTGFQWRPHPNVGAQIGYRFLGVNYNDGDGGADEFEFNGSIAGLYGSLVLRF